MINNLIFTPMQVEDVPVVCELEKASFSTPWSSDTYRRELTHNQHSYYYVIRPDAAQAASLPPVLAYGGYWLFGDEAHIVTIATHPEWRRHHLGEWMLVELLAAARTEGTRHATLEVRVGNRAAIALYTKYGFVEVGLRKRYYRDNNEDARLLTLFNIDAEVIWDGLLRQLSALRTHFSGRLDVGVGLMDSPNGRSQ
jgi:[ribosomal protein S18]-alanine N-acetyltransferase